MSAFHITIDGRLITAAQGETVLEVARRAGIEIPSLCHDPRLDPVGACRTCLVEIDGQRRLAASCKTPAAPDMVVATENDRVSKHRRLLFSLYQADHGSPAGDGAPNNELTRLMADNGPLLKLEPTGSPRADRPLETNPYFAFDPDLCILCARCVRYCDEVEAVSAITLAERGAATTIATAAQKSLMESTCELCGGCVDTCPTGALFETKNMELHTPAVEAVRTTCNYCGVGCQMNLNVVEGRVVGVTSPPAGETLNDGNLCVKGRFAYDFIHHEDRLTVPLIRDAHGQLVEATWDEAITCAAEGLTGVRDRHGVDALGFISSSRCTGEENYLMQKLARAAFGTNNCHQCAAT